MQFIQDLCLTNLLVNAILVGPHHDPFMFTWDSIIDNNREFDTTYNIEDAKRLLQLSFMITDSQAYNIPLNVPSLFENVELLYDNCPISLVSKGLAKSSYNDPSVVANILYNNDTNTLYIIFVGTTNACMGALDVAYTQVELTDLTNYIPGLRGHKGVYLSYISIRDKLLNVLEKYLVYNPTIVITGHSLGGALSQLCALDLAVYEPIHYSFAAPMIYNKIGYEVFNRYMKYSYRIGNISDIVTFAPLPIMPNKDIFYHVGESITFQRNLGEYPLNHTVAYTQEFSLV